ncbi:MAG: hypothetical protein WCC90_19710 [Methylocella sp.]
MDTEHFNRLGPRAQARAIVEAAARARGRAAPKLDDEPTKIEDDTPESLALAIVRAAAKARGRQE